jgi:hypothetical protein
LSNSPSPAKKPEPPNLFWLIYRHPDGGAAGVVVIESHGLLHARLKASLSGADRGLEFISAHKLDPQSAGQIPANMIGRFLDDGDSPEAAPDDDQEAACTIGERADVHQAQSGQVMRRRKAKMRGLVGSR